MAEYRRLGQLNKDELEELKERLSVMADNYEEAIRAYDGDLMDIEQLSALFVIRATHTVTYKDLELFYGTVEFVKDDFFCNFYKEEEEEEEKREPLGFDDLVELALRLSVSQGFYGRLYTELSVKGRITEEKERLDKIIKSWNCYDDVDLIIKIES